MGGVRVSLPLDKIAAEIVRATGPAGVPPA